MLKNGRNICLTCKRARSAKYEAMGREAPRSEFPRCLLAEAWK